MSKEGQYLIFFQDKCPKEGSRWWNRDVEAVERLRPLAKDLRGLFLLFASRTRPSEQRRSPTQTPTTQTQNKPKLKRICAASSYSSPVGPDPLSRRDVLQFKNQVSQIPNTLWTIWFEIAAKIWLTCFFLPSLWNNVEKLNLARFLNAKYSILGKWSLKLTDWSSKLLYHVHIVLPIWTGLWLPPPSYLFFHL